jgi:CheY-like chemotaxis protein
MQPTTNVFVVDDDQPTVELICEVLEDEGYRVHALRNASSALAAIEAAPPDAILLDLRMPGIDGVDLFRVLSDRGLATMPIIFMTADTHAMQALMAEGVKFILLKPFDLETLLNCIAEALGSPQETREQGIPVPAQGDPGNRTDDVHICA